MDIKIEDIETGRYYGSKLIMAHTWNDGPDGVNFSQKDVRSFLPRFTSKEGFVRMVNGEAVDERARFLERMRTASARVHP